MSVKYAKDQPAGFTNRIQNVAIVGASGRVGSPIVRALLQTGKHNVTALTREDSQNVLPDGVKTVKVNYDDEESLVQALKGQQFFIISLSVTTPPEHEDKLIAAAAKAGVTWVMPNAWGADIKNDAITGPDSIFRGAHAKKTRTIESHGVSSWIAMVCNFWYEYSLSTGEGWYGFDFPNKRVTLYDDGKVPINTSTWNQCGEAMASLLSLKELPEDENDTSPTVSKWRNEPLYISSFLISQRDMLESVHRVMGTTDKDWTILYEPAEERFQRGTEMMKQGNRVGYAVAMYARMFYPSRDGDYESKYGLANGVLGLAKEDLDEATQRAIKMAETGEKAFSA